MAKILTLVKKRKNFFVLFSFNRIFAAELRRKDMETMVKQPFNAAQIELLNSVAHLNSEEDLRELKHTLSLFFAKLADREMDRLWDEGVINDDVIEGWAHEHMRTPYHPQM